MDHHRFDAGATLAFLDAIATQLGPTEAPLIEPAWEAAWVACLTRDPRHDAVARAALARVVAEVEGRSSACPPARSAGRLDAGAPTAS